MHTLQQLQSGELKGIKSLKLSCGLTSFPKEILTLSETLEILDLSGNQLKALPDDFGRLKKLKIAFFSNNLFTELPKVLGDCPELSMIGFKANQIETVHAEVFTSKLRWLILTDNKIERLPKTIGKCVKLQKCALAGNKLRELPAEMVNCKSLELIRISANNFEVFPEFLLSLPRMTWLAYAGNPCSVPKNEVKDLNEISWNELTIQEQLGEGASGIIAKASWKLNGDKASREVAVKVFKGEVTSDGYPDDEMHACITAGCQDHLVKVLGKIKEHPQLKQGLVLELIPSSYKNLGLPPSFDTCTRDVFKVGTVFSERTIIKIAHSIASACKHLHDNGILHGDLYAHNTLIDDKANTLLGDFGAATTYDKEDKERAYILERIDVRAFGCLLEDLLNHIDPVGKHFESIEILNQLKNDCMQESVKTRPGFEGICSFLLLILTLQFRQS